MLLQHETYSVDITGQEGATAFPYQTLRAECAARPPLPGKGVSRDHAMRVTAATTVGGG
ncbi:MAG: hypothetical protein QOH49_456 [Acidobacteriota bacterium]|jgi:hypothetical protein|nr:hypothetical protein [Acidobacteriota bacterium]